MKSGRHNYTRKKHKGGNKTIEVDIRQILITKPMLNIIYTRNPSISTAHLIKERSPSKQGFSLTRSNAMRTLNINSLPPVLLVPTKYGRIINGTKKQLYEIQDGRHRIVEAILLGKSSIRAKLME